MIILYIFSVVKKIKDNLRQFLSSAKTLIFGLGCPTNLNLYIGLGKKEGGAGVICSRGVPEMLTPFLF